MKNKKIISSLATVISLGALLVTAMVAYLGSSLGWFSENKDVTASGMSIAAYSGLDTEQYYVKDGTRVAEDAAAVFTGIRPGDQVGIQIVAKNNEAEDMNLSLLLAPATAEANGCFVEGGKYHYFGTQIKLVSLKLGDESYLLDESGYYLLEPTSYNEKGLQATSIDAEYDFSTQSSRSLSTEMPIASGQSLTIDLVFEFVDNKENQNAYIDFGAEGTDKSALAFSSVIICDYQRLSGGE